MTANESSFLYIPAEISSDETVIVLSHLVPNGAYVQAGDSVLELETSKSAYELEAPCNGKITFFFSEGQLVSKGEKLAAISKLDVKVPTEELKTKVNRLFTDSAREQLMLRGISEDLYDETFPGLRVVTSKDVINALDSQFLGELKTKDSPGAFIVGFGHRGILLRELLNPIIADYGIKFVNYQAKNSTNSKMLKSDDFEFYLEDFIKLDFHEETKIYWCVPNSLDPERILFSFAKLESFIQSFVSEGSRVSESSEISQGALLFPNSVLSPGAKVGKGSVLESGAIVGTSARVGDFTHLCSSSSIAHDSSIGNFSTMADGSRVAGRVVIGQHVLIGLNATINSGLKIGNNVTVNSGASVYKNLPDNCIFTREGRVMPKEA